MHCHHLLYYFGTVLLLGILEEPVLVYSEDSGFPPDYCKEPNQPHVGCPINPEFAYGCGEQAEIIEMTHSFQRFILRQHNIYRNIVAKGTLHSLPVAARMLKVQWDEDLAQVADLYIRHCTIEKPNISISTPTATVPGFNSAFNKYPSKEDQDELKILASQLKAWYEEYRYVNIMTLKTGKAIANQEAGHFLQMVVGLNGRLGCAMSKYQLGKWKYQMVICLYGCYKRKNQMTYGLGKVPAEKCECGSDRQFKNLCADKEVVGDCAQIEDHNLDGDDYMPTNKRMKKGRKA